MGMRGGERSCLRTAQNGGSGGSAQRCIPTAFSLMVCVFIIIYKQILWPFCMLDRNICSLKYPLYFRTLARWKACILTVANKTDVVAGMFLPAMTIAVKHVFFLFKKPMVLIHWWKELKWENVWLMWGKIHLKDLEQGKQLNFSSGAAGL